MSFIVCARRVSYLCAPRRWRTIGREQARGQEVGRAATNTRCSRRCTAKEVARACHGRVLSSRRCVTTCNAEYWASCRRPRLQSYIVRIQELGDTHVHVHVHVHVAQVELGVVEASLSRSAGTYLRDFTGEVHRAEAKPEHSLKQSRIRLANIYIPVEQCSCVHICTQFSNWSCDATEQARPTFVV